MTHPDPGPHTMRLGIFGLPKVGKRMLFELLTGEKLPIKTFEVNAAPIHRGVAQLRDRRFDRVVDEWNPPECVPARFDVILLSRIDREGGENQEFFKVLRQCDVLCHVVRGFQSEDETQKNVTVDPFRDIEDLQQELILNDLVVIEKNLELLTIDLLKAPAKPQQEREKAILIGMKKLLDNNVPLTSYALSEADERLMAAYPFLTRKPLIILFNVGNESVGDMTIVDEIRAAYEIYGTYVVPFSARLEAELAYVDDSQQVEFLKDLNIQEPLFQHITRLCKEALHVSALFVVTPRAASSLLIRHNALLGDVMRSLRPDVKLPIRSEIIKSHELLLASGIDQLRREGKVHVRGEDYKLEEGDIICLD